ncbi:MAG: hypothetical protein QOD53_768, partial [Thermoleophilaceae bacterium]|nr:hypothetical protein [Thermoleophilaceae bacterium]
GFDGNTGNVNGSAGGGGGGVLYATLYLSSTTLTLSHVSASRNTATSIGGSGGGDGGVTYGLGLYRTSGSIVADHFNASGNSMRVNGTGPGDADGGVAYAGGAYVSASDPETISFDDSAFEGNSIDAHAEGSGSGGVPYGAGFYAYGSGAVALTRAGISANTEDATARGTGNGGVAYAPGLYTSAPATLTNVTIAGNSADAGAGSAATGGVAYGGGLYMTGGGNVLNATVAGNRVLTSAGGTSYAGNVYPGGTIHVKNTIVSGGQATTKPNCNTALTSDGHNIEDKDECGFHAGGDQFNKDPTLGPLANNGGPSLTRRLLPGSLAINSGDNSGCPATDQRGFPRQGTCDKGAYEYQPADLGLTMRAPAKVGIGAQIDYAVTLKNAGPVSAFGTVLRDPLPAGLAPAGASFPTGPCTVAQVTPCPLGTVGAGQSVAGHVLATATTLGTVQNKVGFTTFSDDANPANDTAAATTKVVHVAAGKVKVPKTIKLGSALPVLQKAKKKKKPKPQFIVFNLNGPAKVTLTFQRKRGKKYKSAGKLTVAGHTGKNKVRFAGRLSKKKRLKPGRYRLVLVAIDATKHKSKPVKRQFKLVKAKKK